MTPPPAEALAPRNATEDAILAAARELLGEGSHEQVTIDRIARRAFVSRTTVYFYFANKRAVMDRLIQQAFTDMYTAGAPYFEGAGEPRLELRLAIARFVAVVNRNGRILMLAASLHGEHEHLPSEWEPYIVALRRRRGGAHRARPGARHRARRHLRADRRAGAVRDGRAPPDRRGAARRPRHQRGDPRARRAVVAGGLLARGGLVVRRVGRRRQRRPQGVIAAVDVHDLAGHATREA